ncbi:F-box protein CPR1-like [Apium graveolens]|uniref:F-box protein CPR1-like n=1 Tax=Apium graveolens TaxID=4045 RepID=UPI003D79A129
MNVTVYFAEDLIAQILDRLSVKTLLRFRCVSKPWCSLIDSPHFARANLKRSIGCNTNTDLILSGASSYWLCADSEDETTAIQIDETLRSPLLGTSLVGACNGLLRCRKLPNAPSEYLHSIDVESFLFGFGYDSINDDYKVLSIFHPDGCDLAGSEVIIYSLKNNSWKRLQNISPNFKFIHYYGLFLGGALHCTTTKTLGSESYQSIFAFDLAAENHREVPMPKVRINNPVGWSLCAFAESLSVLIVHPYVCIDVWLMNDYGVGSSWCKVFSVQHRGLIRSLMSVWPVAFSKSRECVLIKVIMNHIIWYDLETKEMKTVKIANMPDRFYYDLKVCSDYTESLVAPDCIASSEEKQP